VTKIKFFSLEPWKLIYINIELLGCFMLVLFRDIWVEFPYFRQGEE
tara:strand:- start:12941 stop:13078 length:138 start_codon:yes stop_codon:yes gene_type:complete